MSIDVEFGLAPGKFYRKQADTYEGMEVPRPGVTQSSLRELGRNAVDSSGREIPNSDHWHNDPSAGEQHWPTRK